ncbi:sulfonate transport system substrate-binding protein [Blastococcus saxobsidens]|uniref:Sulfonate transport system substrate-binding protein n=2 Tax=Blastococcus saxobsidens TaxID=138336 RepID=A0A4Q7Y7K6_9ACTN|nr:sulfonate transport system substrate-binding protein [Blastococcus saxobsidens]
MFQAPHRNRVLSLGAGLSMSLVLVACGGAPTPADSVAENGEESVAVNAGLVGAIDQIGLPAALDQGFFEEQGLDVTVAEPFATGTDQLNALESGQIDIAQVGSPAIGAILSGADYVLLGNYSGSAAQLGIDETMAVVARDGSGVEAGDLSTLRGKKIGVAIGSINHLYLLSALAENDMTPDDVSIVNTPPPDMAVALQTAGIDVAIGWDPFPLLILDQVPGSYEVARGGGYIGYLGYLVAKRDWVEQNRDTVKKFLTARAAADQWMRENPDGGAEVAARWLSSLDPAIAEEAMQYNVEQLDPRISACNYAALHEAITTLHGLGTINGTFDVNDVFVPGPINEVMEESPELFEDLDEIPASAVIEGDDFTFEPDGGQCSR